MSKTIVSLEILGNAATDVLRREVNALCIEEKIDGDEVWAKISAEKTIDGIKTILTEYFEDNLILV
jgi:hypothetical protein